MVTISDYDIIFNLGVLEIGAMISTLLFGITTSQAYTYYERYPADHLRIKILVLSIWLLELCHTTAVLQGLFFATITQYHRPELLFVKSATGFTISFLLSGLIATIVQVKFADRIRTVMGKPWLAIVCWILSFARLLGTTWVAVLLFTIELTEFANRWGHLAMATWFIAASVDVLTAAALTINLVRKRQEAILGKPILDKIIATTVQTGLVTSTNTVTMAICFVAMPHNFVWAAFGFVLPKLFSISLFASLNARQKLRRASEDAPTIYLENLNELAKVPSKLEFTSTPITSSVHTT
ncbi:hypothetical protein BDN72DRAFT_281601 [Pluteus cervinus]|uniref:Uncharacterized protein n=1 Tax=Pluteus cervinus TaxID=181527 RepID=A0ACD3B4H4_9AGAR|nr:hypothetical protein BDN72DRAFT_281601 [Pluteus cervinus]